MNGWMDGWMGCVDVEMFHGFYQDPWSKSDLDPTDLGNRGISSQDTRRTDGAGWCVQTP